MDDQHVQKALGILFEIADDQNENSDTRVRAASAVLELAKAPVGQGQRTSISSGGGQQGSR